MDINEAIQHCLDIAKQCDLYKVEIEYKCGEEHRRIADWLMELKDLRGAQDDQYVFIRDLMDELKETKSLLKLAMEDFSLDIIVGSEGNSRNIKINLPPFTLVGATTRAGQLTTPLRDRFGVLLKLELYTPEELSTIVKRSAGILEIKITDDGAYGIASRSRGTPRIANRLLKRVRDFALVKGDGTITSDIATYALEALEIDELGLDNIDRRLLEAIIKYYGGGPVGLDTLAATIGEETVTIEDVYEPYLMQIGFLARTPRGRCVTKLAYDHLGIPFVTSAGGSSQVSGQKMMDLDN